MIVFYGNFRQMIEYARRHGLDPRTDLVLARNGYRGIQGHPGPFDVIFCPDYVPAREEYDLLKHIVSINQLTKESA